MASRSLCKNVRNLGPQIRTSVFTNDILRINATSDFDKCHLITTPHTCNSLFFGFAPEILQIHTYF